MIVWIRAEKYNRTGTQGRYSTPVLVQVILSCTGPTGRTSTACAKVEFVVVFTNGCFRFIMKCREYC